MPESLRGGSRRPRGAARKSFGGNDLARGTAVRVVLNSDLGHRAVQVVESACLLLAADELGELVLVQLAVERPFADAKEFRSPTTITPRLT